MQHTRPISGNRVRSAAASFVMCVGHETIIFSKKRRKKKEVDFAIDGERDGAKVSCNSMRHPSKYHVVTLDGINTSTLMRETHFRDFMKKNGKKNQSKYVYALRRGEVVVAMVAVHEHDDQRQCQRVCGHDTATVVTSSSQNHKK